MTAEDKNTVLRRRLPAPCHLMDMVTWLNFTFNGRFLFFSYSTAFLVLWLMSFHTACVAPPSGHASVGLDCKVVFCMRVYMCSLTAVDSRDARVISRFPFMPNTAGTRMKISVTSRNTSQFWNTRQKIYCLPSKTTQQHKVICPRNYGVVDLLKKHLPVYWFLFGELPSLDEKCIFKSTIKIRQSQFLPHLNQLQQNPSWHRPEPSQQEWHQDLKHQRANCLHWCTGVSCVLRPFIFTGSWWSVKLHRE